MVFAMCNPGQVIGEATDADGTMAHGPLDSAVAPFARDEERAGLRQAREERMFSRTRDATTAIAALVGALWPGTVLRAQSFTDSVRVAPGVAAARNWVVSIEAQASDGMRRGSGIVLSADGAIATPAHLVDGAFGVRVRSFAGASLPCEGWIYLDPELDFALIKVAANGLAAPVLQRGGRDFLRAPEGSPMVLIAWEQPAEQSVRTATLRRRWSAPDRALMIELDVPESPGNDGGAVLTQDGRLVGQVARTRAPAVPERTLAWPIGMAASAWHLLGDRPVRPWSGERAPRELPLPAADASDGAVVALGVRRLPGEFVTIATGHPAPAARVRTARPDSSTTAVRRVADVPEVVNTLSFDWSALDSAEIHYEEGRRGGLPTMRYDSFVRRWHVTHDGSGAAMLTSELSLITRAATGWFRRTRTIREYHRTTTMTLPTPGPFSVEIRDRELGNEDVIDSSAAVVRRLLVSDSIAELWVDGNLADRMWVPRGVILDTDEPTAVAALRNPLPDRFHLWLLHIEGDSLALEMVKFRRVGPTLLSSGPLGFAAWMPSRTSEWRMARDAQGCEQGRTLKAQVSLVHFERVTNRSSGMSAFAAPAPHLGGAARCMAAHWQNE